MESFGRMQEKGRRSRAGERRCNLAADMAGFAHARDDDACGAGQNTIDNFNEFIANAVLESKNCLAFNIQSLNGSCLDILLVAHAAPPHA